MAALLELSQKPFIELQIEALVEENRIKSTFVDEFIDQLTEIILSIKDTNYEKILNRTFRLPLIGRPNGLNDDYPKHFKFVPPTALEVIGGYKTYTSLRKTNHVDLAIQMPAQCFEKKDIKNQRYHQKRALYLRQISYLLDGNLGSDLIGKLEFKYHHGDILKPVLLIKPKEQSSVVFQLFVYPHSDCPFKPILLRPDHGNVSPKWFFEDLPIEEQNDEEQQFLNGDSEVAISPFYNSSILFDLELASNSDYVHDQIGAHTSIVEALLLTKIWLYQRELDKHFSFVVSMFISHLQAHRIIHQNMSSYQIFKLIIKSLASSNWSQEGLSYFDESKERIASFKSVFPVVFLSPSGNLNLCFNVTADLYQRLLHEAKLAVDILETNSPTIIELLFLEKIEFVDKFDVIVHLPKCAKKLPIDLEFLKKQLDYGAILPAVYSETILKLAQKGLTDRILLIQQSIDQHNLDKKWNIKSIPNNPANLESTFTFGLLLDTEKSIRIIDVGPEAQTEPAEEFRLFWDPKSQLRLQNGTISETVVWHVKSFSQRRAIIKYILDHCLKKIGITNIVVYYTLLERFINLQNIYFDFCDNANTNEVEKPKKRSHDEANNRKPLGVGEEIFQKILHSYNELNKIIRNIDNLKYLITGIHPMSHHLRASAIFPPMPVGLQPKNNQLVRKKGVTLFPKEFDKIGKILYIEPVEMMLTLESSGKWPNELDALEAAKSDYLIALGEALKEKDFCVKFSEDHLDILYGQFVFRLRVKCQKELILVANSKGKQEFQRRRLDHEILPRIHASLDQLYREKPAFGLTCRLVKRWLSCHLMSGHIDDIVLDLMVAHLFVHPQPFTEPASSICGFRRFLKLIARYNWKESPLTINFDQLLKLDELNHLKDAMQEDRSKFPPAVICTPFDKDNSPWTRSNLTQFDFDFLIKICTKAIDYFKKEVLYNFEVRDECKALFRPNFKLFHLLIKLKPLVVQNFFMNIEPPREFSYKGKVHNPNSNSAFKVMPIVGLNIIEQYVGLLQRDYGDSASFFYDKFGQRVIGVVLKSGYEEKSAKDLGPLMAGMKKLGTKLVDTISVVKK